MCKKSTGAIPVVGYDDLLDSNDLDNIIGQLSKAALFWSLRSVNRQRLVEMKEVCVSLPLREKIMSCPCGRSPISACVGWHELTEEEYLASSILWARKKIREHERQVQRKRPNKGQGQR